MILLFFKNGKNTRAISDVDEYVFRENDIQLTVSYTDIFTFSNDSYDRIAMIVPGTHHKIWIR